MDCVLVLLCRLGVAERTDTEDVDDADRRDDDAEDEHERQQVADCAVPRRGRLVGGPVWSDHYGRSCEMVILSSPSL